MGLEGTHAEVSGQGEGLVVVRFGVVEFWRMAMPGEVAEEAEGVGFMTPFLVNTGVCKGTPGLICGVLDATGLEIALAQIGD
jgi:hypothetical protein